MLHFLLEHCNQTTWNTEKEAREEEGGREGGSEHVCVCVFGRVSEVLQSFVALHSQVPWLQVRGAQPGFICTINTLLDCVGSKRHQ